MSLLRDLELRLERVGSAAPTFPIYDITNPPQDALEAQVAIDGPTDSVAWFSSAAWFTQAPTGTPATDLPQDAVEGQFAIGSDTTFYWYSNGAWHNAAGFATDGNPPQDFMDGQIVIGNADNFCYCVGQVWYTFPSA